MPEARNRPAGGLAAALLSAQRVMALAAFLLPGTAAISAQVVEVVQTDPVDTAHRNGITLALLASTRPPDHVEVADVPDSFIDQLSGDGRHLLQTRLCNLKRLKCESVAGIKNCTGFQ